MNVKTKQSTMARAATVLLVTLLTAGVAWAEDLDIGTVADWNAFAARVNDGDTKLNALLTADLDFSGETFTVVGTASNSFRGTFDGAGHTIMGITVNKSGDISADRQGLFGTIGSGGIVKNVTLSNSSFAGWDYVGGIAAYNLGGTVTRCHVTSAVTIGTTSGNRQYHGGIVGLNASVYSTVSYCTSAATVTDNGLTACQDFGGVVGSNMGGTIEHCLAVGVTVSAVMYSGAVVGSNISTLSCNYYGDCTVGEATSNIGANNGDVISNDGAVAGTILYDNGPRADGNTAVIGSITNPVNIALYGRTFHKDGKWHTLCLPFNATKTGPLAGATIMELDVAGTHGMGQQTGFDANSDTLYLFFTEVNSITAGKPYIVNWGRYDRDTENDIFSPVFSGVNVTATPPSTVTASNIGLKTVDFIGNYNPVLLAKGDKSVHYFDTGVDLIHYPEEADYNLGACRAYFHVDLTDKEQVHVYILGFGDDIVTGLSSVLAPSLKEGSDDWFTIDGRRLNGQPTAPGIYINNGRKIAIDN